jgi:hypothetical protein
MPAEVNIKVGSLRGTNGDDGTTSWPFRRKKSRKVDLTWLTVVIVLPNGIFAGASSSYAGGACPQMDNPPTPLGPG